MVKSSEYYASMWHDGRARMKTTVQVRLYPTPEQAAFLRAHGQEYISTINVLVQALDSDVLPRRRPVPRISRAALPSAVKNQALRDARSVWKRSVCAWQDSRAAQTHLPVEQPELAYRGRDMLLLPVYQDGQVRQTAIRCAPLTPTRQEGQPGLLRIKRKRGKWIAEIAVTLSMPEPTTEQGVKAWTGRGPGREDSGRHPCCRERARATWATGATSG